MMIDMDNQRRGQQPHPRRCSAYLLWFIWRRRPQHWRVVAARELPFPGEAKRAANQPSGANLFPSSVGVSFLFSPPTAYTRRLRLSRWPLFYTALISDEAEARDRDESTGHALAPSHEREDAIGGTCCARRRAFPAPPPMRFCVRVLCAGANSRCGERKKEKEKVPVGWRRINKSLITFFPTNKFKSNRQLWVLCEFKLR